MIPLLALLSSATAGVTEPPTADLDAIYAPRRVALLLGIQEYEDPQLQGLRYASKDARELGAVLADPALGGFDQVHVVEGQHRTTAAAIEQAIVAATADLQRDDTFLLYISGHGTLTLDPKNTRARQHPQRQRITTTQQPPHPSWSPISPR